MKAKNPSLTACKKLIEREQNKNEKPTISHYRDIENGMKKAIKNSLDRGNYIVDSNEGVFYVLNCEAILPYLMYLGFNYKDIKMTQRIKTAIPKDAKTYNAQSFDNMLWFSNNRARFDKWIKGQKVTKNPNPLASVIRDEKLKLARLEKELAKTPRNDYSKRNRLKESISMLKESINFQSKLTKNPSTKLDAVYVLTGNERMSDKLQAINSKFKIGDSVEIVWKGKSYYWQKYSSNGWSKIAANPKTIKPRKNATHADFRNYEKVALNDLSRMFQGQLTPRELRVLEPDIAPAKKSRLGYLVQMKIKRNGQTIPIDFNGESFLSADLRRNLWATGKDSILDNASIRALGIKKPVQNGLTILGDLTQIDYVTAKKHIENGETVRFFHKLGEASGERPKLAIDYDGFPIILGGAYDVWNVGIVN